MDSVKNKVILDFWRVCNLWRADAALHKSTKCGINENGLSHSHTVRDKVTQFIPFKTYIKATAEFHSKLNTTIWVFLGDHIWSFRNSRKKSERSRKKVGKQGGGLQVNRLWNMKNGCTFVAMLFRWDQIKVLWHKTTDELSLLSHTPIIHSYTRSYDRNVLVTGHIKEYTKPNSVKDIRYLVKLTNKIILTFVQVTIRKYE